MTQAASLRVEFHCHSIYSRDGHISLDDLVTTARGKVDVVCITDHDTIEGAREFQRRTAGGGCDLHIVIGEEKTLEDGSHLIGLFLKEPISSNTFQAAVREIREQRGFCILPHPYRRQDGTLREIKRPLDGISGFEIFNPKCSFAENERARDLLGSELLALGGSDAHYSSDLGDCINLIPFTGSPEESLRRFFQAQPSYKVMGIPQKPGDRGRRYAALYYRLKRFAPVPRPFVPAARVIYRAYRNNTIGRKPKRLEMKYVLGQTLD